MMASSSWTPPYHRRPFWPGRTGTWSILSGRKVVALSYLLLCITSIVQFLFAKQSPPCYAFMNTYIPHCTLLPNCPTTGRSLQPLHFTSRHVFQLPIILAPSSQHILIPMKSETDCVRVPERGLVPFGRFFGGNIFDHVTRRPLSSLRNFNLRRLTHRTLQNACGRGGDHTV